MLNGEAVRQGRERGVPSCCGSEGRETSVEEVFMAVKILLETWKGHGVRAGKISDVPQMFRGLHKVRCVADQRLHLEPKLCFRQDVEAKKDFFCQKEEP